MKEHDAQAVAREVVADCCNWHDIQYKIIPRIEALLTTHAAAVGRKPSLNGLACMIVNYVMDGQGDRTSRVAQVQQWLDNASRMEDANAAYERGLAAAVGQWRDIESAPKDGTRILVYVDGQIAMGYWHDDLREFPERHEDVDECIESHCGPSHERRLNTWVADGVTASEPTYWQPRPAPPLAAAGTNKGDE